MRQRDWRTLIKQFPSTQVMVVGDVMLDCYHYGTVTRVSPEAPVVVISKARSVYSPGGAANVAANITSLGGHITLVGVVGADEAAVRLRGALTERCISDLCLVQDASRVTTVKTRIVAHTQHVVRIDEECTDAIPEEVEESLLAAVRARVTQTQGIVLSDYGKGVVTRRATAGLLEIAQKAGVPVFADPKGRDWNKFLGSTLLKPNRAELALLAGVDVPDHEATLKAGALLHSRLGGTSVLVTEGAEGMSLFEPGRPPFTVRPHSRMVFDVTGAGDTVIATVALACAAGAEMRAAAELAARAAARVVEKVGTDVCTVPELLAECNLSADNGVPNSF